MSAVFDEHRRRCVRITAALPCVLAGLIAVGCSKKKDEAPPPPQATVAHAISRRITDWDEFTGRFAAVESVQVRPRASGYIDQVLFREGQIVKKDDVLFVIDPRPYQADYDRARANLALANSQHELAKLEAVRVQKLKDSGAVSQEELDQRLSVLNQQEANVEAAKAALASSALMLSFTKVVAPIDGRVGRAEVTRGNLVTGGNEEGTVLTTLVSLDPIYVYFEGDENAYLRYTAMALEGERASSRDVSNPVRIGLADETGFPHEGRMNFVDNQLNVNTGTIQGRAVLDNKQGRFTPGLFARVQLLGSAEHDAILIDERAVGTDQSKNFVLVVGKDNTLEYRAVELGRNTDGLRIVRAGLKPNELVVTSGLQRLRPGMKIEPKLVPMDSGGASRPPPPGSPGTAANDPATQARPLEDAP